MPNSRHPGRPRKTEWGNCKADECNKSSKGGAHGFCHTHYIAARRGYLDQETGKWRSKNGRNRVNSPPSPELCLVPKCNKPPRTKGMCNKHLMQVRSGIIDEHGHKLRDFIKRPRKKYWVGVDGYALIAAPIGHPSPRRDGTILEHRLIMEQQLGRYLQEWEIVHHKNGNRSDNRPENLELLDGRARHGVGHPPGSEFCPKLATQILLQQPTLPDGLRQWLEYYKTTFN